MSAAPLLEVEGLNAYYGTAHVLQGVDFRMGVEPVSVIVDRRDLRLALSGAAGTNTILDDNIDVAFATPAPSGVTKRTMIGRVTINLNCGFRSLRDGLPTY